MASIQATIGNLALRSAGYMARKHPTGDYPKDGYAMDEKWLFL
jgi:hypothetical protein